MLNRISRIVSTALDSPVVEGSPDPATAFAQHVMKSQPALRSASRIAQTLAAAQALATRTQASTGLKREGVA